MTKARFVRRVIMVRSDSAGKGAKKKKKQSSGMNLYGGIKFNMPKISY